MVPTPCADPQQKSNLNIKMVEVFKLTIKDFPFDYFTIAFFRNADISKLKYSIRYGIRDETAIKSCKEAYAEFNLFSEYSRKNVESYFDIEFCHLCVEASKIIYFSDHPMFSAKTIYLTEKWEIWNKVIVL